MCSTHLARLWTHQRCSDEKNREEPERDQSKVGKYAFIQKELDPFFVLIYLRENLRELNLIQTFVNKCVRSRSSSKKKKEEKKTRTHKHRECLNVKNTRFGAHLCAF